MSQPITSHKIEVPFPEWVSAQKAEAEAEEMNQEHDYATCEDEECELCAQHPVCVCCKTDDDGGREEGFGIQSLKLVIKDEEGVLQEHGWVCGGCLTDHGYEPCEQCGEFTNDRQHQC